MSDTYGLEDTPADPFNSAAEELLYGSPEAAGGKLRNSIFAGIEQYQSQKRIRDEHARSMATVNRFKSENPMFAENPLASAATEAALYAEQIADLERNGFKMEKFREAQGRDPTLSEIANAHLSFRSHGLPVRSAEELFDAAAARVEAEMPGVRRRINDVDASRKRAVADRMAASARSRGQDVSDYIGTHTDNRPPSYTEQSGSSVATPQSLARMTMQGFGEGGNDAAGEAARMSRRADAIAAMKASRGQNASELRGRAPEVQLSRTGGRQFPR